MSGEDMCIQAVERESEAAIIHRRKGTLSHSPTEHRALRSLYVIQPMEGLCLYVCCLRCPARDEYSPGAKYADVNSRAVAGSISHRSIDGSPNNTQCPVSLESEYTVSLIDLEAPKTPVYTGMWLSPRCHLIEEETRFLCDSVRGTSWKRQREFKKRPRHS